MIGLGRQSTVSLSIETAGNQWSSDNFSPPKKAPLIPNTMLVDDMGFFSRPEALWGWYLTTMASSVDGGNSPEQVMRFLKKHIFHSSLLGDAAADMSSVEFVSGGRRVVA